MNDFENKYKILMTFLLPQSNKCINSVEFVEFKKGITNVIDNEIPKDINEYLTPVFNFTVDNDCFSGGAFLNMALKGDIISKMMYLHETYFPERKLDANVKYINLL